MIREKLNRCVDEGRLNMERGESIDVPTPAPVGGRLDVNGVIVVQGLGSNA